MYELQNLAYYCIVYSFRLLILVAVLDYIVLLGFSVLLAVMNSVAGTEYAQQKYMGCTALWFSRHLCLTQTHHPLGAPSLCSSKLNSPLL